MTCITLKNDYSIIEFPWSIPLKELILLKDYKEIKIYEEKISQINNAENNIKTIYKHGSISRMTKNHFPLSRINNPKKFDNTNIFNYKYIFCPTSTMAIVGLTMQKELIVSKYNPYYKYINSNGNYKKYDKSNLIESLSFYLCMLNFSLSDVYKLFNI